jgi:hypothetical protein
MWRIAVTVVFTLIFPVLAGAAGWELISSCPTPGPDPRGYTGHTYGYVAQDGPVPYVYHVDARSGSIFSSFRAPGGRGAWGICEESYSSGLFYISNFRTSWIYAVTEGSLLNSFRCPIDGPADLCWSGGNALWAAIPANNIFALIDVQTGSLISTLKGPGSFPTSCARQPRICVADSGTSTVYWEGYPVITDLKTPTGIDCMISITFVGPHLWIVDDATDHIYEYYFDTPVVPVSFGRIKAIYK